MLVFRVLMYSYELFNMLLSLGCSFDSPLRLLLLNATPLPEPNAPSHHYTLQMSCSPFSAADDRRCRLEISLV